MSTSNRAGLITKIFKVLKKYYKPAISRQDRPLLEHVLYGCCLENSTAEAVDEVFARLEQNYFDWNEIRVTSIAELSLSMASLSDPSEAARRLKGALHGIFETHYAFDIDALRKQNLGAAVKEFQQLGKLTKFGLAYVTQYVHCVCISNCFCALSAVKVVVVLAPERENALAPVEPSRLSFSSLSPAIKATDCTKGSPYSNELTIVFLEPIVCPVSTLTGTVAPSNKRELCN